MHVTESTTINEYPPGATEQFDSAELYDQVINKLRGQVWMSLMILTLITVTGGRWLRADSGFARPTLVGWFLILTFYALVIGGTLLRNTKHVVVFQTLYMVMLHAAIPLSFLFFGGTQGFGDVTLFTAILLAILYGFRRWMAVTFAIGISTFIYVIYLEFAGQPVASLIENSTQFFAAKSMLMICIVAISLYLGYRFYSQLIASYSRFSDDQVAVNQALRKRAIEMKQLSTDLRRSRLEIVASREEERRRLRRDLHDGLGPTLAAQVFRVGAARNVLQSQPEKAQGYLKDLESGLANTLNDVRHLIHQLRPPALDELGLLGAIAELQQTQAIPFAFHLDLPEHLEPMGSEIEVALWRMVQTGLDNVARHAQATNCHLMLVQQAGTVTLTLVDDGAGIAADALEGVGLTSMRERTKTLGGVLEISPNSPHGTRLTIELPFG